MLFEAPCKLDFLTSPRLAASAAPAAFCWAFDLAGMSASFETIVPAGKCRLVTIVPLREVKHAAKFPFEIGRKAGYRMMSWMQTETDD